jgi:hypothetical protein
MAVVGTASLLVSTQGAVLGGDEPACVAVCSVADADVNLIRTRPPTSQKPGGEVGDSRALSMGTSPTRQLDCPALNWPTWSVTSLVLV